MADLYALQMMFLSFVEWLALGVACAVLVIALVAVLADRNRDQS